MTTSNLCSICDIISKKLENCTDNNDVVV